MADEQKGVEERVETVDPAPAQPVSPAHTDDPEARLQALLEENARLTRDRDNYRDATLVLKGKKAVEDLDLSDPDQVEAYISKKIEDRFLSDRQSKADQAVIDEAKRLARENRELRLAIQNKPQISGVGSGSGGDNMTSKVGYFSPEQVSDLHKRWKMMNVPEAKWAEMLKRAEDNAKRQG